jgi:DnaJ-class molecular chaperone
MGLFDFLFGGGRVCPECDGTGTVSDFSLFNDADPSHGSSTCYACKGTGRVDDDYNPGPRESKHKTLDRTSISAGGTGAYLRDKNYTSGS